jgi:type IV pilus biogenesis protein CpaD/CtpE
VRHEVVVIGMRSALLVAAAACLSACTSVEPWQRGNLAKPQMTDTDPLQAAAREHVYRSREGLAGRASSQGGGCGCY